MHSQQPRTQANKISARARAFKTNANSSKHGRCAGARIQKNFELKQTQLMCGRAHSKHSRTQSNNVNRRAHVFKETANASKQGQCACARIQKKLRIQRNNINVKARAFKQSANSRKHDQCAGAHSTEPRTQATKVNAPARAFNKTANAIKQCQCAGARIQKHCEFKETRSM